MSYFWSAKQFGQLCAFKCALSFGSRNIEVNRYPLLMIQVYAISSVSLLTVRVNLQVS